MPKKMGINSKAEDARTRKAEAESTRKEREAREKEDKYWQELEGGKSKASKKREEEAEKRAEALAKKAELKRLAEMEEKEMESYGKKVDKKATRVGAPVPKVTAAELAKQKEEEKQRLEAEAQAAKRREMRATKEDEYERMVSVENVNRSEDIIEARSVEAAIAQMALEEQLPVDRHPEKRLKASYKAFEEAELPKLKAEKPGLSLNQYRDMAWKLWKKSPDNPLNQIAAASTSR